MATEYKVLIADDSAFARRLVKSALENSEFKVVGEAKTDKEAVSMFGSLCPDIVLLDVIMPEIGGPAALRGIMGVNPGAKVIMLSSLGTEQAVMECLTAGARTFLQKPFDAQHLVSTLRGLVGGGQEPAPVTPKKD